MNDQRVIKSYVWHGEDCFFISTIQRDSSALNDPGRYNETLVWKYDWEKKERGALVDQRSDIHGSIREHCQVCQQFFEYGKPMEVEYD